MSKIIFANWKMNPATEDEALALAKASDSENLVICPPFVFLEKVAEVIDESRLGAQDLALEKGIGPYTGEVSAKELKSVGVEYVIIGHSERRYPPTGEGETNEIVAKKLKAAVQAGLVPILCVGETAEQKEAGKRDEILQEEITTAFEKLGEPSRLFIAYEPIWAISTSDDSKPDNPENTLEAIKIIKKVLKEINKEALEHAHFIYGGSVNPDNVGQFLQHKEIEGVLVGSASLEADKIKQILSVI